MTRSGGFARISLSSTRWLLPWIAVLLVSVILAYAMNTALDGGASASDRQPVVHAAVSTGEAAVGMALEQSTTSSCDSTGTVRGQVWSHVDYESGIDRPCVQRRMLYVGLNRRISVLFEEQVP